MGYVSRPGMGAFPVIPTPTDGGGAHAFDGDLANAADKNAATYAFVTEKIALAANAIALFDLGDVYLIDAIRSKIGMWANNNYTTEVEVTVVIAVSANGTDWTDIDTFTDTTTLKNSVDIEVQDTVNVNVGDIPGRYIRYTFSIAGTAGTDNEARIYELWAVGYPLPSVPVI